VSTKTVGPHPAPLATSGGCWPRPPSPWQSAPPTHSPSDALLPKVTPAWGQSCGCRQGPHPSTHSQPAPSTGSPCLPQPGHRPSWLPMSGWWWACVEWMQASHPTSPPATRPHSSTLARSPTQVTARPPSQAATPAQQCTRTGSRALTWLLRVPPQSG
jgi:hypothetical protein